MSDSSENDEEPERPLVHTPFGILGDADQIQKYMDQQQMVAAAVHDKIHGLYDALDGEHLATLRMLLNHIASGAGEAYAAYLEGMAAAMLRAKGVCPGCGEVHDGEGLEWLREGVPDVGPTPDK